MDFMLTRGWEIDRLARSAARFRLDPEASLDRLVSSRFAGVVIGAELDSAIRSRFAAAYDSALAEAPGFPRRTTLRQALADYESGNAPRPAFVANLDAAEAM